jgi:hypothetical protein
MANLYIFCLIKYYSYILSNFVFTINFINVYKFKEFSNKIHNYNILCINIL